MFGMRSTVICPFLRPIDFPTLSGPETLRPCAKRETFISFQHVGKDETTVQATRSVSGNVIHTET